MIDNCKSFKLYVDREYKLYYSLYIYIFFFLVTKAHIILKKLIIITKKFKIKIHKIFTNF